MSPKPAPPAPRRRQGELGADAVGAAVRLVTRTEAMGLVEAPLDPRFSPGRLDLALAALEDIGVGRHLAPGDAVPSRSTLEALHEALESSPCPQSEWPVMGALLTPDLLARLLDVSDTSLRRYASGRRATPDDVAQRLHFLTLVCADLLGAYNDFGVRRWFLRRRSQLGGAAPADVLKEGWQPDDVTVRGVGDLARSLVVMAAG